ncbi:MAG: hypothetical protein Ct9H300mP21_07890 [Pseudomonadota bacterium]|nr:MAG: hypothetical protein Ct9H300mP21_07890 [Pseudomonadota bacterium]
MGGSYMQHLDGIYWDERTNSYRTPAANYRKLVTALCERTLVSRTIPENFLQKLLS